MASEPVTTSSPKLQPADSEAAASSTLDQPATVADITPPGDGDENTPGHSAADASSSKSSPAPSLESGEASPVDPAAAAENSSADASEKSNEETDGAAPPLPNEPPPTAQSGDDGWDYHWDETSQAYYFHNHITGESTWENPRLRGSTATTTTAATTAAATAEPPRNERPPAGGYNPAIHGDYDPNAWYAQSADAGEEGGANGAPSSSSAAVDPEVAYAAIGSFNRFTGRWQQGGGGDGGGGGGSTANPEQHSDENKSRRQMNAYFDVDAAANAHDGRSLKAERAGKKPSKAEVKQFKEKRRAKKEEKRRAWLRD